MNISYCKQCRRVFREDGNCPYCESSGKAMKKNSPVNVIGTKIKGNIFKVKEESISVIITLEDKTKVIKEYSIEKLRKII